MRTHSTPCCPVRIVLVEKSSRRARTRGLGIRPPQCDDDAANATIVERPEAKKRRKIEHEAQNRGAAKKAPLRAQTKPFRINRRLPILDGRKKGLQKAPSKTVEQSGPSCRPAGTFHERRKRGGSNGRDSTSHSLRQWPHLATPMRKPSGW